jgi:hypothetical protein
LPQMPADLSKKQKDLTCKEQHRSPQTNDTEEQNHAHA